MTKSTQPTVINTGKKHWFRKELPFHLFLLPAVIIVFIYGTSD